MIAIMSSAFLDLLAEIPGKTVTLAAGRMLFQRGDPVTAAWVVRAGRVHLLRRQADGAAFILQRAGPGALVAEASLLSDCYHCAAETVEETRLTRWPLARIRALLEADGQAALAFARHLAGEVRTARLRAEITSLRRVADRLDAWLAWHDGALPGRGDWHHLAGELNVSPEALYRELGKRRRG